MRQISQKIFRGCEHRGDVCFGIDLRNGITHCGNLERQCPACGAVIDVTSPCLFQSVLH
ncbi:MAG: hypothetical protein K6U75_08055 [Firmicutes bacterium]|nr:hypothetical protein [Bacillota bacterium]